MYRHICALTLVNRRAQYDVGVVKQGERRKSADASNERGERYGLVMKEPQLGMHKHHAKVVGGLDDILVALAAGRSSDEGCARALEAVDVVAEREEGIR
jgi:hypothetical protein